MDYTTHRDITRVTNAPKVLIAYVYGEVPPDFAAMAACGFTIVCLDSSASWFSDATIAAAKAQGLTPVAFRMGYVA